jgi:enoyl-CoA hydratase/carnithine racemase
MSKASPSGRITVSISDGVASVEIDNPSQRNALTRSMCLELQDAMPRLDADPSVLVVTLSGTGDTFCAGAPINDLTSVLLDPQSDGSVVDQLTRSDDAITAVRKPTIALVDGACMGGGWQIASACDFIVASERSVFAITPAKLGVIYPRVGIERLVRQVGPDRAKFIVFSGQKFSASRAQALGLVAETVADSEFAERCRSLIASLTRRSQFSIHTIKHLIDLPDADAAEIDHEWAAAWAAMSEGPDLEIGVAAFLGREQPRFTWTPGPTPTP